MPIPFTDDQLFTFAERVKGKVVVITGAASGIGREAALTFAKYGSNLVIGDVDGAGGEAVVDAIRKEGGKAEFIKCNVTKWNEQVALFDLAMARFGAVDVVIPNAGINESEQICWGNVKFVNGKPAEPELLTLKVNMVGLLYTAHLGVYYMKRDRPAGAWKSLVMTGSMASWIGLPHAQQYSTAKHGVLGLMRSLDPVLAGEDIRIACIHPWFTETNLFDWQLRVLTAGVPLTPIARVAGAMFRAATDPDPATSGCPWLLPDDGPVLLLEKESMREGVYAMVNNRVRRVLSFRSTVLFWLTVGRDLSRVFRPVLVGLVVIGGVTLAMGSNWRM